MQKPATAFEASHVDSYPDLSDVKGQPHAKARTRDRSESPAFAPDIVPSTPRPTVGVPDSHIAILC